MDSVSISMFRNLEQSAIRENNFYKVTHKNAIRLVVANRFYVNTIGCVDAVQNSKKQQPKPYRLNHLA